MPVSYNLFKNICKYLNVNLTGFGVQCLTVGHLLYILFNMKIISTRDLLHRTKEVRSALEMGESLTWTSRGKTVAYLQPPKPASALGKKLDWVKRARAAGAVNKSAMTTGSLVYEDRE